MLSSRPVLVFAALLGVLQGPSVEAQTVSGRVVTESDGRPVPLAEVSLLRRDGGVAASVLADSAGRFVARAPSPGEYRISVDRLGYLRLESPLLDLGAGRSVNADFELPIDAVEIEGLRVEAEAQARVRRELRSFGVRADLLGERFIDQVTIDRRHEARDFGRVLQWQSIPGMTIQRWDDVSPPGRPFICVRLKSRGQCALNVLNGAVVSPETGAEIPTESLGAIAVLTPEEATLLYGTDGGGGAVLMFSRDFGGRRR